MPEVLDELTVSEIVSQCAQERTAALLYRQNKVTERWQRNEDFYYMAQESSLDGSSTFRTPRVFGLQQTFLAKISDDLKINYEPNDRSDVRSCKIYDAIVNANVFNPNNLWNLEARATKHHSGLYGRGIAKLIVEKPFNLRFLNVDIYNFYIDPLAGGIDMEKAAYMGEDGIYKTEADLLASEIYNKDQVQLLIASKSRNSTVSRNNELADQTIRDKAINITTGDAIYTSEKTFKLTVHITTYKGVRYYVLFDPATMIWLTVQRQDERVPFGYYEYVSFATCPEKFEFWTPSYIDAVLPLAEVTQTLIRQEVDNRYLSNYGMMAYNVFTIPDPRSLNSRPRGLVPVKGNPNGNVAQLPVPQLRGTIELVEFLNAEQARDTGISPQVQGVTDVTVNTATESEAIQAATNDRFRDISKLYGQMFSRVGFLAKLYIDKYMPEDYAVKIIGQRGIQWKSIKKSQLKLSREPSITVTGDNTLNSQLNKQTQAKLSVLTEAVAAQVISPKKMIEKKMEVVGFTAEEIKSAFTKDYDGDSSIIAEADEENVQLINGEEVKPNRGATEGHLTAHLEFLKTNELTEKQIMAIQKHIEQEIPIAEKNKMSMLELKQAEAEGQAVEQDITGKTPEAQQPEDVSALI